MPFLLVTTYVQERRPHLVCTAKLQKTGTQLYPCSTQEPAFSLVSPFTLSLFLLLLLFLLFSFLRGLSLILL